MSVIPPLVNPLVYLVPEYIAVESNVHPATVPDVAAPTALISASEVLSTLPNPTSVADVLLFNVLSADRSVVPILTVPVNVPPAPEISPLKKAFPRESILNFLADIAPPLRSIDIPVVAKPLPSAVPL